MSGALARTAGALLLLASAAAEARAEDLLVPAEFRTLEDALDAALPGDRVVLLGGRHRVSRDRDAAGVEIVAEGRARLVARSRWGRRRLIRFEGDGVTLRGLEFRGARVDVNGNGARVEGCSFRRTVRSGTSLATLSIFGEGAVVAENGLDRSCRTDRGIEVTGAGAEVTGNLVEGRFQRTAISVSGADALLHANEVSAVPGATALLRKGDDGIVADNRVRGGDLRVLGHGNRVLANEVSGAGLGQASLLIVGGGNEVRANAVLGGLDTGFLVVGDGNWLDGNSVAGIGALVDEYAYGHGFVVRGSGNLLTADSVDGCRGEGFRVAGNGGWGLVEDPDTGAMYFGPIPRGPGNRLESCSAAGAGICGLANLTVGTAVTASSFLGNGVDVVGALPFESFAGNEWETGGPLFRGDGSIGSAEDTRGSAFLPEPDEPAPAPPPKAGIVRPVRAEEFHPGAPMLAGRAHHTASALLDGGVLLAGGQEYDGTPVASCEAWSPETEAFAAAGPLASARRLHAAAVLPDGRVLVCGGFGAAGTTLSSAEIFDPASRTWTAAAPMAGDRARHTATPLADGRVLVTGGYSNAAGPLAFAASNEIFDPIAGSWSAGPAPVAARGGHTATRLPDGRVLLAGGARFGEAVAEVFDPAAGTLQRTAGDPAHHRVFHGAALTESGRVLLAGGGAVFAEIFDPATGRFSGAGATPVFGLATTDSVLHGALVALPGDRAVLVGGLAAGGAPDGGDLVMASLLLWDGRSAYGYGSAFPMAFDLAVPRAAHTVTPTAAGYLIAGGFGTSGQGAGSERRTTLFRPGQ